jgi:hypothetical protein
MLTPTDIHYVVGLLSRASHPESVEVEMGNFVWDEASETNRDVDVTITARNPDNSVSVFKGIEVKAHTRKLGSEAVEQLSQKMKDMPTITHRAIISSSGFTKPAIKKAAKHGVELFELKDWEPANDFEFFTHQPVPATHVQYGWAELTSAQINPSDRIPEEYRAAFQSDPTVVFEANTESPPTKFRQWLKALSQVAAQEAEKHFGPHTNDGVERKPATINVRISDGVWALVGDTRLRIQEVCFVGIAERRIRQMPSTWKAMVRLGERKPLAGCCISDFGDFGLLALIITEQRSIEVALVPVSERNKNKIFHRRILKRTS